jgi:uncharacterized protein
MALSRFRTAFRALTLALVLCAVGVSTAYAAPLRALLLTGQNNHDWRSTTPFLKQQLEATGRFAVDVTEDPSHLSLGDLRAYDVLIDNYFGDAWSEATNAAFLQYLDEGGGVVVIHAADNAFVGWAEFESLVGALWRAGTGHGTRHRYVVTLKQPEHPILRGLSHFLHTPDELYHKLQWSPDSQAEVIADAYSRPEEGGTGNYEPMLIVNRWGRGRMFHTAMGHDNVSLGDPVHAVILARGAEWAATGKVTLAVPADLPNEYLTSSVDPEEAKGKWQALGLSPEVAARIATAATPPDTAAALAAAIAAGDGAARVSARQRIVHLGSYGLVELMNLLAAHPDLKEIAETDMLVLAGLSSADRETAKPIASWAAMRLEQSNDLEIQRSAIRVLGLAGSSVAISALEDRLGDADLGDDAIEALSRIPGAMATASLTQYLRTAPDLRKPKVLVALGERGDLAAVKRVIEALSSKDAGVAAAATRALGSLPTPEAAEALTQALTHDQPLVRACAAIALLEQAIGLADTGQSAAARAAAQTVLKSARSDVDAAAAARVLGLVGDQEALDTLRQLAKAGRPLVRVAATEAIGRVTAVDPEPALLELADADLEEVVLAALPLLGARGTDPAIEKLSAITRDEARAMDVRAAAASAVGRTSSPRTVDALLKLIDAWSPDAVHSAAFAALLAVGRGLASSDPVAATDSARWLYYCARTSAQKAAALHLAGDAPCDRTVGLFDTVVRTALTELTGDDLAGAAHAAVAVASGLLAEKKQAELESLCLLALEKAPVQPYAQQIADKLTQSGSKVSVAGLQGFVTKWQIIGPFPNDNGIAFSLAYAPEEKVDLAAAVTLAGTELRWKAFESPDAMGRVNLREVVAPEDNVAAYAYAEVTSASDTDALLKLGSDDGIVAWVNGEKVHAMDAARPVTVDQDVVRVHLKAGSNALLLKVLQGSGDWGFCCRVTDPDGRPIRGE